MQAMTDPFICYASSMTDRITVHVPRALDAARAIEAAGELAREARPEWGGDVVCRYVPAVPDRWFKGFDQ